MRYSLSLALIVACTLAYAQATITGTVTDRATGEPLPFAHVFISGSSNVAVTNDEGRYALQQLVPGTYQFVVSFVGYETVTRQIAVSSQGQATIDVKLAPLVNDLENIVVTATEDKEWRRNLRQFKRNFLGETRNARQCELANPWVLDFQRKNQMLTAKSEQPLEIINNALGYKLNFYIRRFLASNESYAIVGPVRFGQLPEPIPGVNWEENRRQAFLGSQKHFFTSLAAGETRQKGFRMYRAVNALEEKNRSLYFLRDLDQVIKETDLKDQMSSSGDSIILSLRKPVEVHFEPGTDNEPVYKDVLHQVSWLQSRSGVVVFNSEGVVLNPQDVEVIGYWNRLRVGDMLPLEYSPGSDSIVLPRAVVNMEIVTDRDQYQPGDVVWYSVLLTGGTGQVDNGVHLALLDSANNILARRLDPLELRRGRGHFKLPMQSGTYFLAALTTSTYRVGELVAKPVVVTATAKVVECPRVERNTSGYQPRLTANSDSKAIGVTMVDGDLDTLAGTFVMSVTTIPSGCDCLQQRKITFNPDATTTLYDGVPAGRVLGKRGKPLTGKLLLVSNDLAASSEVTTGDDGRFRFTDVVSFDSSRWVAYFSNTKGEPVDDYTLEWDQYAHDVSLTAVAWPTSCVFVERPSVQHRERRPVSTYSMSDSTRLLEEVTVRARRLDDVKERANFRPYGQPRYVLKGETLQNAPAGINVLNTLNGRVPGLRINESMSSWTGNASTASFRNSGQPPMIFLDGIPLGTFTEALPLTEHLSPADIERVEVISGAVPMLGSQGAGGVIALFSRKNGQYSDMKAPAGPPNRYVRRVVIAGYSPAQLFKASHVNETIHWNAQAVLGGDPYEFDAYGVRAEEVDVTITGFSPDGEVMRVTQKVRLP